jgi:hypothetical protein
MDADLTSFLKGRRLAWARRESTMRVYLENVDENQQRLSSKPGVAKQKAGAKKIEGIESHSGYDNGEGAYAYVGCVAQHEG